MTKSQAEKLKVEERKRVVDLESAYAELQESKNELIRSEKFAFTGRIAASIAHEIRNPLTNVSMSVEQLKKVIKPKNPKAVHVEIILKNIERINYLITELINCARPPKLKLRLYNTHDILKDILKTTGPEIELHKVRVVEKLVSRPPKIRVDKEQVERALLNIVINAISAMPKRGKLTIITELNRNFFVIKIQDTGKGIPEKNIIKIFDPFFSSKPDGVGLGLTVCYGIIVSHGGTIEVESKSRKGSIFTISLPLQERHRSFSGGA